MSPNLQASYFIEPEASLEFSATDCELYIKDKDLNFCINITGTGNYSFKVQVSELKTKGDENFYVLKWHSMAQNRCCQNINKHLFLDDLYTSKYISFI